jgi:hypothetical protein
VEYRNKIVTVQNFHLAFSLTAVTNGWNMIFLRDALTVAA